MTPAAKPRTRSMRAAPQHHEVLLENERVRVLDTRLGPGEQTPVHTHRWPGALYVLSSSDFVRVDANGDVLLDSQKTGSKRRGECPLDTAPSSPTPSATPGEAELHTWK